MAFFSSVVTKSDLSNRLENIKAGIKDMVAVLSDHVACKRAEADAHRAAAVAADTEHSTAQSMSEALTAIVSLASPAPAVAPAPVAPVAPTPAPAPTPDPAPVAPAPVPTVSE